MDILEWLQTTVDREPPEEENIYRHHFQLPPHQDANPQEPQPRSVVQHQHARKRQKFSGEEPWQHRLVQDGQASPRSSLRRHRRCKVRPWKSDSLTRSICEASSIDQRALNKPFERRPRHKTRLEIYEPRPKRRKQDHAKVTLKAKKPKRRKSRRDNDNARTAELVQSFPLKDRPEINRMTLRPHLGAGIFKHGRASAPVVKSGHGVPDLIFNEMNFLQRPKEHQDEAPPNQETDQQKKKPRKQSQEEEISAFFARVPGETHHNLSMRDSLPTPHIPLPSAKNCTLHQEMVNTSPVQSPPSKISKPPKVLSPRSKSQSPDACEKRTRSRTESPYTWSQSAPTIPHSMTREEPQEPHCEDRLSSHVSELSLPGWEEHRAWPVRVPQDTTQLHVTPPKDKATTCRREDSEKARQYMRVNVLEGQRADSFRCAERCCGPGEVQHDGKDYNTSDILEIQSAYLSNIQPPLVPRGQRDLGSAVEAKETSISTPSTEDLRISLRNLTNPLRTCIDTCTPDVPLSEPLRTRRLQYTKSLQESPARILERVRNSLQNADAAQYRQGLDRDLNQRCELSDHNRSYGPRQVMGSHCYMRDSTTRTTSIVAEKVVAFDQNQIRSENIARSRRLTRYPTNLVAHSYDIQEPAAEDMSRFSNFQKTQPVTQAYDVNASWKAPLSVNSAREDPENATVDMELQGAMYSLPGFWRPHVLY